MFCLWDVPFLEIKNGTMFVRALWFYRSILKERCPEMLVVISKESSKCFALLWRKPAGCHEEDMLVFTLVERFAVAQLCWAKIWTGFSSCLAEYLSTGTWWTGSPCVLTMGLSSQLGVRVSQDIWFLLDHWSEPHPLSKIKRKHLEASWMFQRQ